MMLKTWAWTAAAVFATTQVATAQTAAPAAPAAPATAAVSSAAKKELVSKVLSLQQGGIEAMSRGLTEQPAMQIMGQANQVLQRLPAERREAVARDIEADLKKYVEETTPIVRDKAMKLAPSTIGAILDERFSEDELRQIVALLESPVNRKFQGMTGDMQRAITEKVVAEARPEVDPKLQALQLSVAKRLGMTPQPGNGASAGEGKPAAKPAAPNKK
jgi:uncharacterized protein